MYQFLLKFIKIYKINYFYKSLWLIFCTLAFLVLFCISFDDLKKINLPFTKDKYLGQSREVIIPDGFHRVKSFLVLFIITKQLQ